MRFEKTEIDGLIVIYPDCFSDNRGWFMETYSEQKYKDMGIDCKFVQDNQSFSKEKGTLRGLHFQKNPMAQSKLVRCPRGALLDVAVDMRKNSPTYKKWFSIELNEENKVQLFIPQGFIHGFVTLKENTEIQYKVDNVYSKECDRSVRFDDAEIGVNWGVTNPIVSQKDMNAPLIKDSDINF